MHEVWPAPGTLLASRYRLVSLLETGGMAEVWRAVDESLDRPVAVKLASTKGASALARREARLAARLSHPRIAAVHDYREAVRPDGSVVPFVVMELLIGETVVTRLANGPLPWPEAAAIGAAVADALAAAHASGVVHRDIKPGNVMLCPGGVKLLDFGISADAGEPDDDETGATFGTPAYAAPERLDGKPAEPATDLYGLGVLLFEMLAGQPPYGVDTWEELALARAAGPAPMPQGLPAPLHELITRCLDDDPHQRPTAAEAGALLGRLARTAGTPTLPIPPAGPAAHAVVSPPVPGDAPLTRRRLALALALTVMVATVAFALSRLGTPSGDAPTGGEPAAAPTATASTAPSSTTPPAPAPPPSSAPVESPAPRATTTALDPPAPPDTETAVAELRAVVERSEDQGRIREDVATDMLNLITQMQRADPAQLSGRVEDLRVKVRDRLGEGSLTPETARLLQDRLAAVDQAAAG